MHMVIGLLVLALLFVLYFFVALAGAVLLLLPWLVVGLIAGWLASQITHSPHGLLGDLGIGLAGSLIGGVLYAVLTHHERLPRGPAGVIAHLVVATIGAVILLLIIKALSRPRSTPSAPTMI